MTDDAFFFLKARLEDPIRLDVYAACRTGIAVTVANSLIYTAF